MKELTLHDIFWQHCVGLILLGVVVMVGVQNVRKRIGELETEIRRLANKSIEQVADLRSDLRSDIRNIDTKCRGAMLSISPTRGKRI